MPSRGSAGWVRSARLSPTEYRLRLSWPGPLGLGAGAAPIVPTLVRVYALHDGVHGPLGYAVVGSRTGPGGASELLSMGGSGDDGLWSPVGYGSVYGYGAPHPYITDVVLPAPLSATAELELVIRAPAVGGGEARPPGRGPADVPDHGPPVSAGTP